MHKILIVEDESSIRDVLHKKLQEEGYTVLKARNGEEGLATAIAEHPSLILADIVMPRMDGLTMLKKLREDEWGKNAEVVMLTNLSDVKKAEEAGKQGVQSFLLKTDWKLEDLMVIIKSKLLEQ